MNPNTERDRERVFELGLGKKKSKGRERGQRKVFAAITFKKGNFLFADGDRLNPLRSIKLT